MSRPLLLGIDEGTSAVKAVLYDTDLKQQAEARRDKPLAHPRAGLGGAGPAGRDGGGGGRRGRAARDGRRRGGGVRARPPGRIGARLGGRERGAAHPDRDLAGQALPGGARPPRGGWRATPRYASAAACRSTRTSRPASSPGCSSTSRRCSERSRRARCGSAPSTRGSATCSGPASPPIPPPRRAPSSRRPARPTGIRGCSTLFGVPRDALPAIRDSVGDLGMLRHPDWDARAAAARPGGGPAGRAGGRRLRGARSGEGHLRHRGVRARARGRPSAPIRREGGLLPTVAWRVDGRVEYALDGGVFTAGALLEWLSRDLGLAADPPALAALASEVEDSAGRAGAAGARRPRRSVVAAGCHRGHRRAHRQGPRGPCGASGTRVDRVEGGRHPRGGVRARRAGDAPGGRRADPRSACCSNSRPT